MASMNCKRMVAVATLATSVVLMGGSAFASPASAIAGYTGNTKGLAPDPAGKVVETARNTVTDGLNQIKGLAPDPAGRAVETASNTGTDGLTQIRGRATDAAA